MAELRRVGTRQPCARTAALGVAIALFFSFTAAQSLAQAPPTAPARPDIFPLSIAWMVTLDTPPAFAPAYDGERVYIALKADEDGGHPLKRIAAYSLTDGSRNWVRDAPDADSLATGDSLLFASSGPRLDALSAADGAPRWQITLDAPLSAPLQPAGGWIIAATQASHAYGIRASDGKQLWDVHLPSPACARPAVAGDAVFLPLTDNRVVRLDVETGAVVWDRALPLQPTSLLALDDRVFVGMNERWFYALSPRNGDVDWRFRIGGTVVGNPAADASRVYFLALDNLLRALGRSGGSLEWRQMLGRRARFGPYQLGSLLVVSGASPVIEVFDAKRGTPAGTFEAPHDLKAMPVHPLPGIVERDFLLIALTGEGELLAIRPHSLEPEKFAVSPRLALVAGFPYWIYP